MEVSGLQLREKSDFSVGASDGSNARLAGPLPINLQVGYSPINHLGIFASHLNEKKHGRFSKSHKKQSKVGIGGYYFFQKKNYRKKKNESDQNSINKFGLLLESYLGMDTGNFGLENYKSNYYKYQFQFRKSFIQTGVHWMGELGGIGLFYNLGRTNFYKGFLEGQIENAPYDLGRTILNNNNFTTSEASFNIYFGIKAAKIYLNTTFILNDFDNKEQHPYNSTNLGMIISISEIYTLVREKNKK